MPWALPPAEDLARGADLKLIGERTVAVVPHYEAILLKAAKKIGAEAPRSPRWGRVHLRLRRRRPAGRAAARVRCRRQEVLYREIIAADGVVRLLDAKGKELLVRKATLREAAAPDLTPDTKALVVLPLPYRTANHVKQTLKIEKTPNQDLRFKDALPLFAAEMAAGNTSQAVAVFTQAFHARDQRQLGFYVLLAACGANLDGQNVDVLAEHVDEPLAQYLALHSSPVLRKHASQWAVGSGQWGQGFLHHLGVSHALYQRWQSDRVLKVSAAKRQAERQRALDYVRRNKGSVFGWVLLTLLQDRAGKDKDVRIARGRCLAPVRGRARPDLRRALRARPQPVEERPAGRGTQAIPRPVRDRAQGRRAAGHRRRFPPGPARRRGRRSVERFARRTAAQLIAQKHRPAVLALAWQCWQLDDQPLANHLLATALDNIAR